LRSSLDGLGSAGPCPNADAGWSRTNTAISVVKDIDTSAMRLRLLTTMLALPDYERPQRRRPAVRCSLCPAIWSPKDREMVKRAGRHASVPCACVQAEAQKNAKIIKASGAVGD